MMTPSQEEKGKLKFKQYHNQRQLSDPGD